MSRAFLLIRSDPHYRSDAFRAGLEAAGYEIGAGDARNARSGDVVCMWNRYGANEQLADQVERRGVRVLVAENGYLGADSVGRQKYALALHAHNGAGKWIVGEGRWNGELKPWRADGGHILVCGQRGIGSRTMASPPNWHEGMVKRLRTLTNREIVVRPHPGMLTMRQATMPSLESQLEGAWAVVIWSSSSGVKALAAGIPVFYDAPNWICEAAATRDISRIEDPPMPDRTPAFEAMSWAQWTVDELASGEPFRRLLA